MEGNARLKNINLKKLNLIFSFGVRVYFFARQPARAFWNCACWGFEIFEFFVRFEVLEVSELVNFVFYGIII